MTWWRHRPDPPLPSRVVIDRMSNTAERLRYDSLRLIALCDELRDELTSKLGGP